MSGRILGGRYELGASLGAGGMATVWQATDRLLGRQVAVKVLREQYAVDPSFLARFQREARHAASVSDPRIVTVFDCGVDAAAPFIVMELVSGRTLRQVLDQARMLPAGEAVSVAAEMCGALEVAHAAGLVHRDIKPANVLITSGGQVKILDFGIARMAQSAGLTQTGTLIGTAEYLSPEQAASHRPARRPTCTRSAASCTRCSPARPPSPPIPPPRWSTGTFTTSPRRPRPAAPACPRSWTDSSCGCSPRTPPPARAAPPPPAPPCSPQPPAALQRASPARPRRPAARD